VLTPSLKKSEIPFSVQDVTIFPLESIVVLFVSTPVSEAVLNTVIPVSDRTLPLKVVVAMLISLSWQMSARLSDCQGINYTIHKKRVTRKPPF